MIFLFSERFLMIIIIMHQYVNQTIKDMDNSQHLLILQQISYIKLILLSLSSFCRLQFFKLSYEVPQWSSIQIPKNLMFISFLIFFNTSEVDVFYYHQLILQKAMCFIRNSCAHSPALLNTETILPQSLPSLSSKGHLPSFSSFECLPSFNSHPFYFPSDCQLLGKLLAVINQNSQVLTKLNQSIDHSAQMLQKAGQTAAQSLAKEHSIDSTPQGISWRAKEPVIQKLFGEKEYKYKLKLRNKFPTTIYKERNIAMCLELVDSSEKPVMNSNLINICAAACETNGHWIAQTEEGEYFIQGKTEIELYHGEAIFQKIYPRDVSRQFQNGKVDIVIYPKPSLIQFSTFASHVEERVRAEEIEPLLIKDITIRAKKKTQ